MSRKSRDRRRKRQKSHDEEDPSTDAASSSDSDDSYRPPSTPRDERPRCMRHPCCMPYCCRELRDCLLAMAIFGWAVHRLADKYDWWEP